MKTSIKRNLRRVISLVLAVVMCICCIPFQAFAWKNMSHVTSANLILLEMQRSKNMTGKCTVSLKVPYSTGQTYTYEIPQEYQEAILSYPDAFRAGSMGPDFYPDMLTGQGLIHPYDSDQYVGSGEWITLLCDSVNMLPKGSEKRKQALAFTLGFMLHYCGDMFGHDFINTFAGGTYPDLKDTAQNISPTDYRLNIILSHMSEEEYMDGKVNWGFFKNNGYLNIAAPVQFISDTMLYNGNANNGPATLYDQKYRSIAFIYEYFIRLRVKLYAKAEEWRVSGNPAYTTLVKFLDRWIEDLDTATYKLTECFDTMANRMVSESSKPEVMDIVEEELMNWLNKYGKYATPVPDIVIDTLSIGEAFTKAGKTILQEIGAENLIQDIEAWKKDIIKKVKNAALGALGLSDIYEYYKSRMKDPSVQLDDPQNPYKPSSSNFKEFDEYIGLFASEQNRLGAKSVSSILSGTDNGALDKALDSGFEAFYNTLTMYKLILIGPDNFTNFIKTLSGVTQNQYKSNNTSIYASSLDITVKTADREGAGTDSNIFALVSDINGKWNKKKLLDKSDYNDFEKGDHDTYSVELGCNAKIDEIEVKIVQEKIPDIATSTASPWDCEEIEIMPKHAGINLLSSPIALGSCYGMDEGKTWNLHFHDEIMMRTGQSSWNVWDATKAKFRIVTATTSGAGTDAKIIAHTYYDTGECRPELELDLGADYNDFENGSDKDYIIPLSNIDYRGVEIGKLHFKLEHRGSSLDAWTPAYVEITLYHGDIQLTDPIYFKGGMDLKNSFWTLDTRNLVAGKLRSGFSTFSLDYTTNVDDGMLDFMYSLDDSHQWVNSSSILWNNITVRRNVFFKIFKGFSPDISYVGNAKEVKENQAFDMDFSLEGVWNGVPASRRDKMYFDANTSPKNSDAISKTPAVNGTATLSFINSKGTTVASTTRSVSNGTIQLRSYKNTSLKPDTYSVKVSYSDNTSNPMYADSEKILPNVLTVKAPNTYTITFKVQYGSWNDGTTQNKTVTVTGYPDENPKLTASQIPAVGDKPSNTYKAGMWDYTPNTTTVITENKTYIYSYKKKDTYTQTVHFKVENGSWDDETTDDIDVVLSGYEGDVLKLTAEQIPAAGSKPDTGYEAGSWDVTPDTESEVTQELTYTYTYAERTPSSDTVTFKVVNGAWDNGSTDDIVVTVNGYVGDALTLAAAQIPAVGQKPDNLYKAGSWDVTPDTTTEITNSPTFTYTYAAKEKISQTVTFKVANGSWDNGTTDDVTVVLNGYEGDVLKLDAAQIPAAGSKPITNYKAGSWNVTPTADAEITGNPTYTYTYAAKQQINQTVTFKVVNGSWNDGTTADKSIVLFGYEGDVLKLTADQIPAVGSKPDTLYKAGSWDVTPSVDTAITGATTYTYTYAERAQINQTVTFKVVNGAWNNGNTTDVTVVLNGYEGDILKLTADQIPAAGEKPDTLYKAGSWNVTPDTTSAVTANKTYTYTYAARQPISQTVTFKVVNGSWDNGETSDITVVLSGYEGDTLVLNASQVPAVGSKPGTLYKAGSWNVTPDTTSAVTANKTYTYTYAARQPISQTVTFKVVNGAWDNGTTDDVTVVLNGYEGDILKLDAAQIPAVGNMPDEFYKAGSWNVTPDTSTEITNNPTYTYTYAAKEQIGQTVTFQVVNGSWNNGTTDDVTVVLNGYEGDILKLDAAQIPAVGNMPDEFYKAGSWNVTPDTSTEITGNPTYTYTYLAKGRISYNVTFTVVNGAWNDDTADNRYVTLEGYEGDILKLAADQIPAAGDKPDALYRAGRWDITPSAETEITADTTYTYTYSNMTPVNKTVTFRVVNGAWNDGTTDDKIVSLDGYDNDVLTLDASQIPTAGNNPDEGYKAGNWDTVPGAGTEIVKNLTFTYSYISEDTTIPSVPQRPIVDPSIVRPVHPTVTTTTTPATTTAPEEADPDTTEPVTTTAPGAEDPDTTEPVTTTAPDEADPDTTEPVIADPDTTEPAINPDDPAPIANVPDEVITLDDPVIPAELLEEIKGKNIDVVIEVGDNMQWTINGRTITGVPEDIDLTITNDSGIPVDVINRVTGERYSIQIHLDFDGPFPFEAVLTINLKASNAGYYANLFYFNPETKQLEYISASRIDEAGNADLNFYHASDYTIIIDSEPMDGQSHTDTVHADSNPHTAAALEGVPALGVFAAVALIFGRPRRKKNKETK